MNVGACGRRVAPSSWIPACGISSGRKLKRVWFRGDQFELDFGLFDAATRRVGVSGGQDCPCFTSSFGLCNKRYDGVGDGANKGIQD